MDSTFSLLTALLVSFVLGGLSGVSLIWRKMRTQIDAAYARGKEEMEDAKTELSEQLKGELESIRERLLDSLAAYDKASKAVDTRLAPSKAKKLEAPNGGASLRSSLETMKRPKQAKESVTQDSTQPKRTAANAG